MFVFSCSDDSDDEEVTNFVRKIKKRTRKYKGKIPFKCFNYGKIGHFPSKWTYAKMSDSSEENEKIIIKGTRNLWKGRIYVQGFSSFDKDDDCDDNSRKVLFMALEETANDDVEDYVDGGVDIEVELISALSEPKKERKKTSYSKRSWVNWMKAMEATLKRQIRYL